MATSCVTLSWLPIGKAGESSSSSKTIKVVFPTVMNSLFSLRIKNHSSISISTEISPLSSMYFMDIRACPSPFVLAADFAAEFT